MTRIYYSLLFFLLVTVSAHAQWVDQSITHDGLTRQYRLYIPQGYDASQPAPLVIGLHGLYGTMEDFEITGITDIADTAQFLVAAPQALDFESPFGNLAGVWNAGIVLDVPGFGALALNEDVDDVGFLNAMADAIAEGYSLQEDRLYIAGISLGGFMTQRMACGAPDRYAAVASIMGTYALALPPCQPEKVLPIAHFHGTQDQVVTWNGGFVYGSQVIPVGLSVDSLISSWVQLHQSNPDPEYTLWPNTNNDSFWVEHYSFLDNMEQSKVELFKLNGGDHFWYDNQNTGGEIDLATEVWRFFNKQYYGATLVQEGITSIPTINIYPNPATQMLQIRVDQEVKQCLLLDMTGRQLAEWKDITRPVDVSTLPAGNYLLQMTMAKGYRGVVSFVKW